MATLHLMVGLPCSGKTTKARQLEKQYNALLLTPDVWRLELSDDEIGMKCQDRNNTAVESILRDHAARVLNLGVDVILDFGFWVKEERDNFRQMAKDLGAGFKIHYLDVPVNELYRRLEARNKNTSEEIFVMSKEEMDKYIRTFQPPTPDELRES